MSQVTKWLAAIAIAIAFVQTILLPANAEVIHPGELILGPLRCSQIEVSAAPNCDGDESGTYSIELTSSPFPPLTEPNFVGCSPEQIESYYPPNAEQVKITNIGETDIEVGFLCD